jgi:hypothetical protein
MTGRELLILGSTVIVLYSAAALPARTDPINPTCCSTQGDCDDGSECDYSESCGPYPGTCVSTRTLPSAARIAE